MHHSTAALNRALCRVHEGNVTRTYRANGNTIQGADTRSIVELERLGYVCEEAGSGTHIFRVVPIRLTVPRGAAWVEAINASRRPLGPPP